MASFRQKIGLAQKSGIGSAGDEKIILLETLVDELVKKVPQEKRVRTCMEAAGLKYSADPIARMSSVLEALEGVQVTSHPRRPQIEEQV